MRTLPTLVIALVLLLVLSAAAFPATRMPTWPQSFSVEKGETATFGIPVTQAGTIEVSLSWQGGPLVATLKNAEGKTLLGPSTLRAPSSTTKFNVTAAMLQQGMLVAVSLSSPDAAKRSGQITATYPAVDNAKFEAASRGVLRAKAKPTDAQLKSNVQRVPASFVQRRNAFLKAREAKLAAMTTTAKNYTTRMMSSSTSSQTSSGGSVKSIAGAKPAGSHPATHLQLAVDTHDIDVTRLALAPQKLTSVSPTTAKSGATVTLTGENLLPDSFFKTTNADIRRYWDGAMFTVAANTDKPGTLSNARKNADGTISMDAKVPNASGLINTYNGAVCLYGSSGKTNTVSFKFQPSGLPTITSITPNSAGPGDQVSLKGYYFSRDDKVFIDIGKGDQELPVSYVSDKEVRVYTPDYTSRTPISARIYIAHNYSYGWNGGAPQWFNLVATEITISSVSYVSGSSMSTSIPQGQPGDPIVISGAGFVDPKVHFIIGNGMDKVANVDFSDSGTIRTSVPDVTGISADYAGSVYVVCNGKKTNLVNFTFHPTLDYQILDLYKFRPDSTGDMSFSDKGMSNWYALLPTEDPDYPNDYNKWTGDVLAGMHSGELLWGFKDDDLFFQKKRLKNNWKVDYIDLTFKVDRIGGGARLDASSIGTDSPYAKVHWWVEAVSYLDYYITWHLVGPKGCSYY